MDSLYEMLDDAVKMPFTTYTRLLLYDFTVWKLAQNPLKLKLEIVAVINILHMHGHTALCLWSSGTYLG